MSYSGNAIYTFRTPDGQYMTDMTVRNGNWEVSHHPKHTRSVKQSVMNEYQVWTSWQERRHIRKAARERRRAEIGFDPVTGLPFLLDLTEVAKNAEKTAGSEDKVADATRTRTDPSAEVPMDVVPMDAVPMDVEPMDNEPTPSADRTKDDEPTPRADLDGMADAMVTMEKTMETPSAEVKTRTLKRPADDDMDDSPSRTVKRIKTGHLGGVFGQVFQGVVGGIAREKVTVRPSWEGRRFVFDMLRSVQLTSLPMEGLFERRDMVSQVPICV